VAPRLPGSVFPRRRESIPPCPCHTHHWEANWVVDWSVPRGDRPTAATGPGLISPCVHERESGVAAMKDGWMVRHNACKIIPFYRQSHSNTLLQQTANYILRRVPATMLIVFTNPSLEEMCCSPSRYPEGQPRFPNNVVSIQESKACPSHLPTHNFPWTRRP